MSTKLRGQVLPFAQRDTFYDGHAVVILAAHL